MQVLQSLQGHALPQGDARRHALRLAAGLEDPPGDVQAGVGVLLRLATDPTLVLGAVVLGGFLPGPFIRDTEHDR